MTIRACSALIIAVTLAAPTALAAGAIAIKNTQIARLSSAPRIDGRLDEPVWREATRITDVSQYMPGDGEPPSEPTEFYVAYDRDNLYIGARFGDSEPEKIRHSQLVQGQAVFNDDYVQIMLDPYNNRRTGYIFYVNPNGVRRDGLLLGGYSFNMDWDGIWQGDAQLTPEGWTAEIALPFKTFPFDAHNDTWGINLLRSIRRKREEIAWSHRERRITMDVSGTISGLRDLERGSGLDVSTSVALTQRERFATGARSFTPKPSLDAFYRVTPSLTAALTVNTDFSATDVDDRQVNLTRFSLFFPEKRDFFLDNAEAFEFAGLQQNGRPFFSRTIGLSATGQPIDLDAGAKLTGAIGRYTVGVLAVRQEATDTLEARDLFIGRAYASLFEQSTVGAIVTYGDPVSARRNHVVGLDVNLRDGQRFGSNLIEGRVWAQRSWTDGLEGDDAAFGANVGWPNDKFDAYAGFTEIQRNFRPALGFVNRTAIREYEARAKYRLRFASRDTLFRSWLSGFDYREVASISGVLESRALVLTPLLLDTQIGDQVGIDASRLTELLQRPFTLPGGLIVGAGRYDFERLRAYVTLTGSRPLALSADVELGDFYNGRRRDTKLGAQWRPNEHLFLNAQYATNRIELPSTEFTARIYSLTANVAFNVHWAWLNVAQYDNVSRRLGLNSRLRWLPNEGRSAYLVVNYDWREDVFGRFQPFAAETTLKFNYILRF